MEHEKVERINELARLKKERPLTSEEETERGQLYREYLDDFKRNVAQTLDNVRIQETDGTLTPLQKKADKPQ